MKAQALDETLQLHLSRLHRLAHHRAKRVDEHELWVGSLDLPDDALQHALEAMFEELGAAVQEPDAARNLRAVEESILLLVAEHLQRRLTQDGHVECRPFGSRGGEHELMGERRLSAAHSPGDQVERELRDSSAENFIETSNSRGQPVDTYALVHSVSFANAAKKIVGQTSWSRFATNPAPMKRSTSRMNV